MEILLLDRDSHKQPAADTGAADVAVSVMLARIIIIFQIYINKSRVIKWYCNTFIAPCGLQSVLTVSVLVSAQIHSSMI